MEFNLTLKLVENITNKIIIDFPEISADYENNNYSKLIEQYYLLEHYDITKNVARSALSGVMKKLIPANELKKISKKHIKAGLKYSHDNKKGFLSWDFEQRSELSKISGPKMGALTYKNKTGVHGRTKKQRIIDAKKGAAAIGHTPWIERQIYKTYCVISEREYAYNLSHNPDFQTKSKYYRGKNPAPDNNLIAKELNKIYHQENEIRNYSAIAHAISRMRKKKPLKNNN